MIEITGGFPVSPASSIPTVTAAEMAEVDGLAVDDFGIDILQMMEQAGSHLAELVWAELGGDLRDRRVVVAVGPGNNGGGGLVAARHLANRGAAVRVILARPVNRLSDAGRHQLATLLQMSVDCCVAIYDVPEDELDREFASADAAVDAVLGYRASGPPHDGILWLVDRLARVSVPVISLDLPSGVDADSGEAPGTAVTATATLTLALPKPGLFRAAGRERAGRVYLGDIGLPAALYRRLGFEVGRPFASGRIVRLEADA
ncbi:MAG TPA: NAD(P)H-hydrate epimerase [Candidatus Limnocylindrales bacterium]|nr:NAD(P)H-hydrate epimerase [Candidatus Limnocylindrales bacterium]